MLDATLKSQLKTYLEWLSNPIEIVASLDDGEKSREMLELLTEINQLSEKVSLKVDGDNQRKPSFVIKRVGQQIGEICFAGIPMGHEFTSLVLALLQAGGHPPKASPEIVEQIKGLTDKLHFETYISLSCQNCPDVVQALNTMAVLNPNISHTMIDGAMFINEVSKLQIMSVPTVFVNGQAFGQGRMTLQEILAKVDTEADQKEVKKLNAKQPFDVLIIGGGSAGSAAAIYTARKGLRTGLVSERLGGQVQDTLAIENFISTVRTEGPRLAAQLEEHIKAYDVDLMSMQRAKALLPAKEAGKLHEIEFESGAILKAKTIIISTGARWRSMNVPGESEYRARGVAYCPHCDGPLFKGKDVAVVGGGNSGVEAAIDLAGVVNNVTLLEFGNELRADAILQKKLTTLANVKVIKAAQTMEVLGDGQKVIGLTYKDRNTNQIHTLDLAGIFVQIGLVPNTDWLKGTIDLNERGEIMIGSKGQTSIPGIFAAGDVTNVPYKQIVIAIGEGAKAALGSFDYLIRSGL